MEHTDLISLIKCIEYGTNLHICVVFLDNYGNFKTRLPFEQTIHSKSFCDYVKYSKNHLEQCVRCRNLALKRAIQERTAFGGYCSWGIYEYCCPVIMNDIVVAVIFLGNILKTEKEEYVSSEFINSLERDFPEENCETICSIVGNHIKLLLDRYPGCEGRGSVITENIKNYLEEFIFSAGISVEDLGGVFNYNSKYLGKLFKKHEGKTIKEYINLQRLKKAAELLENSEYNITDISVATGFNNVTYFSKMFRKKYNMSPGKYRREHKKQAF